MKMHAAVAIAAAAFLCSPGGRAAAEPVLTFAPGTGRDVGNGPFSVGWRFDVLQPVTVTGLGWYDQGGDGLEEAHTVGLWGPDRALRHSATVPSGSSASLVGQFRTVALPAFTLSPGKGYTVGGRTVAGVTERITGGDSPFSTVSQTVDPRIRYVAPVTTVDNPDFARPDFPLGDWGFYGPSFSVLPAPTPVPKPLEIEVSSNSVAAGDRFTLGIVLRRDITQPFDFYLIASTPAGTYTLRLDGAAVRGIRRIYANIPGFAAPFSTTVLRDIAVPRGLAGTVTFYAGVIEAGMIPPVGGLDELSAGTPTVIMLDTQSVAVRE
ncbi:MAG: DUF4082 domain-containing protein [bacterium]|nr:DUF4082 domain-containing protein [bacterium]